VGHYTHQWQSPEVLRCNARFWGLHLDETLEAGILPGRFTVIF
jgi:hypothetical protein